MELLPAWEAEYVEWSHERAMSFCKVLPEVRKMRMSNLGFAGEIA
jgi:hypothetical protein